MNWSQSQDTTQLLLEDDCIRKDGKDWAYGLEEGSVRGHSGAEMPAREQVRLYLSGL